MEKDRLGEVVVPREQDKEHIGGDKEARRFFIRCRNLKGLVVGVFDDG